MLDLDTGLYAELVLLVVLALAVGGLVFWLFPRGDDEDE